MARTSLRAPLQLRGAFRLSDVTPLPSGSLSSSNKSTFQARLCKLSFQLLIAVNSDVQIGAGLRSHDTWQRRKLVGALAKAGKLSAELLVGAAAA